MKLKSLKNVKVKNKRVLLRCGFDVPFNSSGKIQEDERIRQSLPTIRHLIKNRAKVIILSHNGRPGGKYDKRLSMDEVGRTLSRLLKQRVIKEDDCVGPEVENQVKLLGAGQLLLLENLRFNKGEKGNVKSFARKLAALGDIYINDAFSNSHRQHASMVGVPKYLPAYAGFLVEKEVEVLTKLLDKPKRPFVGIVGGAKISDKLQAIINLFGKVDAILIGGALANTILKAQGIQVGKSLIEKSMLSKVKKLDLTDIRLKIPVDVIVANKISSNSKTHLRPVGSVKKGEIILDIGEDTLFLYEAIIKKAKQIVWAGPMGYFEIKQFAKGSERIAQAIARSKAKTIVGGGDTLDVLGNLSLKNKISFVSSGGGAMLTFLEGKLLPALKPLIKK